MKRWVKALIGFAVVLVVAVFAVFRSTSGMVETADAFLEAVRQQDISKAHSYLAEDFKASTDETALQDFLSKGAILDFKEASWSNRQVSGGQGELEGSIETETGGVVPIRMTFVKENDAWKIYAIQKPTAGLQPADSSPAMPAESDQVALVKQSMHDFIVSVENKSMEHFHGTVSRLWQEQHTSEQLDQAFQSIIDSDADWGVLNSVEPMISAESKVDENGVLLLVGYYPTSPSQVIFEQKYIFEGVAWKLIGFNIEAR